MDYIIARVFSRDSYSNLYLMNRAQLDSFMLISSKWSHEYEGWLQISYRGNNWFSYLLM